MSVDREKDGEYSLVLENRTGANLDWPDAIEVSWASGFCVAADGGKAYRIKELNRREKLVFCWKARDPRPVGPSSVVKLGWMRFSSNAEPQFKTRLRQNKNKQ